LGILGHTVGWPMARGGSQRIADALVGSLVALGGRVECGRRVSSLDELPPQAAVVLDLTPRQVLAVLGDRAPARYAAALRRYRYGPGVHKVDWILHEPIPWANPAAARAGTLHLGGTLDEIVTAEDDVVAGRHPERPFVLLAQPTRFDADRAPAGVETAWAYCHVPSGSTLDMTDRIEAQVERFAPGFRDTIRDRHVMGPAAMEAHNENYVGGDINGGAGDLRQLVARPRLGLHPWRTPVEGVWICSASTPPGGGVHGMGGHHAAMDLLARRPA
jgi:phytoene dehydrogenase-like protein